MKLKDTLYKHYQKLFQEYGDPISYWPQWNASRKSILEREKVLIGMVLVQRTSWHNANIALKNLKKENLLSINKIAGLKNLEQLTTLIRSAGFYQSKPKRLFDLCGYVCKAGGIKGLVKQNPEKTRQELLSIKGVGQETADTILLYALDKPVFIIDEYTRRWTDKNNLAKEKDYLKLQQFFHNNLKPDLAIYRNLHTLIIVCQRGREKSVMETV